MATASCAAARASSRRPTSLRRLPRLLSDVGQVGEVGGGAGLGQLAADGDRLLRRGEGLLPPPDLAQAVAQVVQRPGQVGEVGGGAGLGQLRGRMATASWRRGQGLLPPPDLAQAVAQVAQRHGQVGEVGGGAGLGQLAVVWRPPPAPRRVPPPAARPRSGGCPGCSATRPGRGGRRRGWPRPAGGRMATASCAAVSASSRRPTSARRLPRLLSIRASSAVTAGSLSARARSPSTASAVMVAARGRSQTGRTSGNRSAASAAPWTGRLIVMALITAASSSSPSAARAAAEIVAEALVEDGAELVADGLVALGDPAGDGEGLGELAVRGGVAGGGEQARVLAEHVADQDLAEPVGFKRRQDAAGFRWRRAGRAGPATGRSRSAGVRARRRGGERAGRRSVPRSSPCAVSRVATATAARWSSGSRPRSRRLSQRSQCSRLVLGQQLAQQAPPRSARPRRRPGTSASGTPRSARTAAGRSERPAAVPSAPGPVAVPAGSRNRLGPGRTAPAGPPRCPRRPAGTATPGAAARRGTPPLLVEHGEQVGA